MLPIRESVRCRHLRGRSSLRKGGMYFSESSQAQGMEEVVDYAWLRVRCLNWPISNRDWRDTGLRGYLIGSFDEAY